MDEYISSAPKERRAKLEEVRKVIRDVAPEAKEGISYGLASYHYRGALVWFGLSKNHIGLYVRPPVVEEHKDVLAGYVTTKSAVHLPLDRKTPVPLIRRLVKAAMKKNEERTQRGS